MGLCCCEKEELAKIVAPMEVYLGSSPGSMTEYRAQFSADLLGNVLLNLVGLALNMHRIAKGNLGTPVLKKKTQVLFMFT